MCSMSNQECRVRPTIMNININEPLFYPYSILVNKCSGSCNNTNDPYTKLCVPDVVKDMNINEIRHVSWHKTCTCKCRLDSGVCNNNQLWNNDKYRCECE